jgi:hypothetical protein
MRILNLDIKDGARALHSRQALSSETVKVAREDSFPETHF